MGGDENPSLVFEHAKIAGKMLQADAATSTLRVVGTAEAWLHLTYRLNQLLPHFAKDGLVAAALATGPKERREAARRALELRELLRSELDHSALAPRELSEEEDFLALMDDMAARGALDRAGGGGVAAPASPGAPWEEAALGALLLQPALGTYAAVLRAGAAALAESGGMTEKELLQRIQGAIISASCGE